MTITQQKTVRPVVAFALIAALGMGLTACASPASDQASGKPGAAATQTPTPTPTPVSLDGKWKQTNSASTTAWQAATISGATITIDWVSDGGKTTALYWAGSVTAPTTPSETFTWDSKNDHSQTDTAMLASTDDTKKFTYDHGVLSYKASALGTTTTITLSRQP